MSWECACGIKNGDKNITCGGCGWSKEQSLKYKENPQAFSLKEPIIKDKF